MTNFDEDTTIDEKIDFYLKKHGITDTLVIPEEEKEILLLIFTTSTIDRIFVENGDLIIESWNDGNEQSTI